MGIIIFLLIMIPNILYAIKHKESFSNNFVNKKREIIEQIARYGCIIFLIFNIPMTYTNYWFNNAKLIYIIVNSILVFIYLLAWIINWKCKTIRACFLSITPSLIFIFSGVMILSIPLITFALIFAGAHVYISLKNCTSIEVTK